MLAALPPSLLHPLALVFGYLLGSIPFGLLLTRSAGTTDIRSIGSGNIGATNVLRTGRKDLAALTLLGDALKGTLAVLIAAHLAGPAGALAAGLGAFLGHVFPVWLKFRGGKGVATSLGVLVAVAPLVGVASCLTWIAVAALLRISSLAALVAALSVGIAFPFTYRLVKLSRGAQIRWLVFLLSILSLSEVIIGFAWSTLLSRTAGITNLFVALGLMAEPQSLSPSFGALLAGLVYQAFPYTVLVLYPALARLDPYLEEAARTLGSSPLRAFFTVVVPALRNTIVATTIMVFVFALGSYLLPQLLGRPQHWTLSVLITDQAIYQSNMPFAAAMAVFLVLVSLALVGLALLAGRREETA